MPSCKVIFCTDGIFPLEVGGMQRHSKLLVEALAAQQDISIVVLHPHSEKLFSAFPAVQEISIQPIDKSKNYLLECYRYSRRIAEQLRRFPDYLVYSQGLTVWAGVSEFRNRLIVNPHGLEPYQALSGKEKLLGTPFRLVFDHIFRNAARVVSLGGRLTKILTERPGVKSSAIAVLPNAVSLPPVRERKCDNTHLHFLFVARFAFNKGIHILLQAAEELNAEGLQDKITFHLGGKGPLFEEYSKNRRSPNVIYHGFLSDAQLDELYRTCDLFVFPTMFEGMPTVVLEAMSHGMPAVVSDVGASAELVTDATGFLIERNNVNQVKSAIRKYMQMTAAEREQMSAAALEHVRNKFTWPAVARQHRKLFDDMLSR